MSEEPTLCEADLGYGLVFRYWGPQTDRRVYFGTIGDDPAYSNELVERVRTDCAGHPSTDWGGEDSSLTGLASPTSRWLLLQFEEQRLEFVLSRLRELVKWQDHPTPPAR